MASKTCETCIWSRGYLNPDRDPNLLFKCIHPSVYYAASDDNASDILCICQRSYCYISAYINNKCGVQGRFYNTRG